MLFIIWGQTQLNLTLTFDKEYNLFFSKVWEEEGIKTRLTG
jgi:hypothetical protein